MQRLLRRACHATNLAREQGVALQPGLIMLIERCFDAILADGLAFHQAGVPSGTARCFAPSAKAKLAAAAADRS